MVAQGGTPTPRPAPSPVRAGRPIASTAAARSPAVPPSRALNGVATVADDDEDEEEEDDDDAAPPSWAPGPSKTAARRRAQRGLSPSDPIPVDDDDGASGSANADDADDVDAEGGASDADDDRRGSQGSSREGSVSVGDGGDDVEFVSSDDGADDDDDAVGPASQSSSSGDSGSDVDSASDESNTFAALEAQVFQDTLNHLRQLDEQTALQAVRTLPL